MIENIHKADTRRLIPRLEFSLSPYWYLSQ